MSLICVVLISVHWRCVSPAGAKLPWRRENWPGKTSCYCEAHDLHIHNKLTWFKLILTVWWCLCLQSSSAQWFWRLHQRHEQRFSVQVLAAVWGKHDRRTHERHACFCVRTASVWLPCFICQELKSVGLDLSHEAADLPVNRPKNRYTNILPCEWSAWRPRPTLLSLATASVTSHFWVGW